MKNNPKRTVKLQPVRPSKHIEVLYRKRLITLIREMRNDIVAKLKKVLKSHYTSDSIVFDYDITPEIRQIFQEAEEKYTPMLPGFATEEIARRFILELERKNESSLLRNLSTVSGKKRVAEIDLHRIINNGLRDKMSFALAENINLIKNIPKDYLKNLESAVYSNLIGANPYGNLVKAINKCGITEVNRAKLIARDQTAKINASLNRTRYENLGSIGYQWSTSEDARVRSLHRQHDRKYFLWEKWTGIQKKRPIAPNGKPFLDPPVNPKTGMVEHPGMGIQCRCIALPVISMELEEREAA